MLIFSSLLYKQFFISTVTSLHCRLDILLFYHPYLLPSSHQIISMTSMTLNFYIRYTFISDIYLRIYYLKVSIRTAIKIYFSSKTINSHLCFILMTIIKVIFFVLNHNIFSHLYRDFKFSFNNSNKTKKKNF